MALEIRVESAASGGLKIIDHIPAERPCRLEGRNGIGKSALIRVLVLLGGQQPYRLDPASWRSLRDLIGPTVINIEGLVGGQRSARVQLTPETWPTVPEEVIGDWLGSLELDAQVEPISKLFDLFSVVHLSGTERLADTLSEQQGRLGVALAGVAEKLDALNDQRAELGEVAELLRFASPNEIDAERATLRDLVVERTEVKEQLEVAKPLTDDLQRAHSLQVLVAAGDAAEHAQRLADLRVELETARGRLTEAERNRNAAVSDLDKGSKAQKEAAKLERRLGILQKEEDELLVRQEELAGRIESIAIPTAAETLDESEQSALDAACNEASARQHELLVAAARSHRTSVENRLVDDVRVVLDDAVDQGLSDTIVARVDDLDITVADLREGLGYLADIDPTEEAELAEANETVVQLGEVRDLFERRVLLKAEEQRVRKELEKFEPDATSHDELRQKASQARDALEAATLEVRMLNSQIGALSRSVLGGEDVADVESMIADLLSKHDVELDRLPETLAEALGNLLELQGRESNIGNEIDHLTANGTRRRLARENLRRGGSSAFSGAFIEALASELSPELNLTGDQEWPDEAWQQLSDHVAACKDAFDRLAADVAGLRAIAAGNALKLQASRMGGAVRAVVEAEALAELSSRPIAEALFDGGIVTRVNLDEDSSTITWTTESGETRTRPMSAFSSGEQALGFMRARLQQVADEPAENRLVFLDEFGAFISADRRRPLAELLSSDELKQLADQVVVVLPLQVDYADALDETTGELRDTYLDRAKAIEEHGYFTEALQ